MIVELFLLSISSTFGQFIPVESDIGTIILSVDVEGAEANPQHVCLDTGSKHSYLLSNEVMQQVRDRQRRGAVGSGTGIRNLRLTPSEMSLEASANQVQYVDETAVRLSHWRRRRFTIANTAHNWNQKFAVAILPDGQLERWEPRRSGLVGASPDSRFAESHRNFGISPRPTFQRTEFNLFLEPIRPEWCRDNRVVYSPISATDSWLLRASTVSLGPDFIVADNIPTQIDTGCSVIYFPVEAFELVKAGLNSLNLPSLVLPPPDQPLRAPTINLEDMFAVPDLFITIGSGSAASTIRISKERLVVCVDADSPCRIKIIGGNHPEIIIGSPLFTSLMVEFDTSAVGGARIGFCEPAALVSDASSPPLITFAEVEHRSTGDPARPSADRDSASNTQQMNTPMSPPGRPRIDDVPPIESLDPGRPHPRSKPGADPIEVYLPLRIPHDQVEDPDDDEEDASIHVQQEQVVGKDSRKNKVITWITFVLFSISFHH
jgi:hypothetical protein